MAKLELTGLKLGADARQQLRLLAVVPALLALWLGWNAVGQWRADNAQRALESLRDQTVAASGQALEAQRKQLAQRLASAPVQAALATGDNAAAAAALAQGWSGAKQVEIVPANLDAAYAGLPKSGFARLALFESALQENAAVADSVRDGAGNALIRPVRREEWRYRLPGSRFMRLAVFVDGRLQQVDRVPL